MYEGGAGGYSFYTRDGEQIVRQRKNNSNYGESASRTHAQMVRRVKWANLVNVFKAMKTWQPSAYEYKAKGQTDYNIFMSLNINSAAASLTKDQANNGCAVMDAYQISRGSLPPITTAWNGSRDEWRTDIVITAAITAETTLGALSSDIIANNPQFVNGDNIAIVAFSQFVDSRQYPYVVSVYNELTLDKDSSVLLNTLPVWTWLSTADSQFLSIAQPGSSFGSYSHAAAIHTRKADSLMVSTQNLVASPASVVANYSSSEWVDDCIDSYGLDEQVPLNPFSSEADSQWSLVGTHDFIGAGPSLKNWNVSDLPRGTYRISCSPANWSVEEITNPQQGVFFVSIYSNGQLVKQPLSFLAQAMRDGLQVVNLEFTSETINGSFSIGFRADTDVDVNTTLEVLL